MRVSVDDSVAYLVMRSVSPVDLGQFSALRVEWGGVWGPNGGMGPAIAV